MTFQLRRDTLIEGGHAQHGLLPHLKLVDIFRQDLHLERKVISVRYDQHDRICRRYDAPHRMHSHFMHRA